ncbi:MAG: malto-oligosyltrehalose synthase [Gemmatimonadetes bacterium]|nr:malto-oligosyltrehalose synthase [Gemmatimonadota bacterium]
MPRPPLTATYRLQMNAGFTLANARERVDYFAALGVSHLYLSPIFAARRGSMHGYDVVDPTRVNPELGSEADLRALAADLHARGMGLMLDIVPNHMGIGPENVYWDDVLTHGERSRFAPWFDIEWNHHKVILPILGDELDRVLERGELSVKLIEGETPRIVHFSHSFPVDPASLPPELQLAQVDQEEAGGLAEAYSRPEGRERLRALLEAQHYRLVFWRRGQTEINYRRFFDVNDLIALRMEDRAVFDATHAFVLGLVRDGTVDVLRIDHIDGLLQPAEYLARLRAAVSPDTPLFVEKILSVDEKLPADWPVQGTTGYDFLNDLGDVFVDPAGFREIERSYRYMRRLEEGTFHDVARAGKAGILAGALRADVERLAALLQPIARAGRHRWAIAQIADALAELVVALPVYRTYIAANAPIDPADRARIERAAISAETRAASPEIVAFARDVMLDRLPSADPAARLRFVQRFQQLSGPATAKGVEDTALYAYVPLASRNEVGGSPDRPLDDAVARLHEANLHRAEHWPLALLTTTTHDTKRSADVRARLDALSEMPHEWERSVRRWRRLNDKHRKTVRGRMAPDTNSEYVLYQSLLALWPAPRAGRRSDDVPDRAWRDAARHRLTRYMLKAAREAKNRTSWTEPDAAYEEALTHFVGAILEPADDAPFLPDVARLVSRVANVAAYNALARTVIHLTAPGTPDIYQGDELWDYVLVDPDNRRQVEYDLRAGALADLASTERRIAEGKPGDRGSVVDLFDNRTKLLITHRLLAARRAHADLFAKGSYRGLSVKGSQAAHVIAFARSFEGRHVITAAPRLVCDLLAADTREWWGDTAVELPEELRGSQLSSWIVTENFDVSSGVLEIASLFAKLPVAVVGN